MARKIPAIKIVDTAITVLPDGKEEREVVPAAGTLELGFVIRYHEAGLCDQEIAKLCNCSEGEVFAFRHRHDIVGNNTLDNFKKVKGKVFDLKLRTAMDLLDRDKMSHLATRDFPSLIDTLNKNSRLEQGESTSNVVTMMMNAVKQAEQVSDERHKTGGK